ncbi:MAG: hypothetical protein JW829_13440 [Pirellulales bacterium]|nr:hypothetical protein [Pirellulales bacterium]
MLVHFLFRALIAISLSAIAALSYADIIVDPENIGAIDVVPDPSNTVVPITNPVPDPLDLDSDALAVGNTADGTLALIYGWPNTELARSRSLREDRAYIGDSKDSTGSVVVDGLGS